jgi:hypothetical protein
MKRTLPVALLALLLVPAAALAVFKTGNYAGKTSQKLPVSFTVTASKLKSLNITVEFTCTDGDKFNAPLDKFPPQNAVDGRYSATYTGSRGASSYEHKGKIVSSTATGTFTGKRIYNTENKLDPAGTTVCKTGKIKYSIKRKGK